MTRDAQSLIRTLPSVDALLQARETQEMVERYGRPIVVDAIRAILARRRDEIWTEHEGSEERVDTTRILHELADRLAADARPNLRRLVNATGIILHTGLGRAVLPRAAIDALSELWSCCNIQIDLDTGQRIKREAAIRNVVRRLTGAEEVLLVNNNAGATMLVLRALAEGREVIVSRGELIEIGGSFRLPDIMRESGAAMREVGSTNKTHLRDYEAAAGAEQTALLFKAHKSNYQIVGFTHEVGITELAKLGRSLGVPTVDDLGCGALIGLERFGLAHEMTVRESLDAGADIVLFSTDKLIGGPQGGMIVGRKDLLARIRSHPLYRALRVGKLTLTALEATLRLFLNPDALPARHPTYAMLARNLDALRAQAEAIVKAIAKRAPSFAADVVEEPSHLGGGSLPGSSLASAAVRLRHGELTPDALALALRRHDVPVISHTTADAVHLNMRTVCPEEVNTVVDAVAGVHEGP